MAIWLNLKKKVSKDILEKFIEASNTYFNVDIPETHPKCSTTYLGMAICNLALCYRVTKEKKYLTEAIRFMDGVCHYKEWGHAHLVNVDLSASFILFGLSLAYDYLKDYLTAKDKNTYYKNIKNHAKIIYDYKINNIGHGWPTNYWQNHNWINHTALLISGYILKEDKYIKEALDNFEIVFNNLPDDGSNYEGISYHRYGGMWLFIAAWLIKELGYTDYFTKSNYLKNTFYFRLYSSDSSLVKQLNFGDCHDRFSSHAVFTYYLIAKFYNDPYAKYYGDYILKHQYYREQLLSQVKPGIMPEMWLCYLAYPNNIGSKDIKHLPLFRFFPDLGYVSIRDSWNKDSTVFIMKSSYPGGKTQWINSFENFSNSLNLLSLSHHHPDNLSYQINCGLNFFITDDGYNRNISNLCHNSLLVDGKLLDVMDVNDCYKESIKKRLDISYNPINYKGEITNLVYKDDYLVFKAESTNTYPIELKMDEVSRYVLVKPNLEYILFIDKFSSNISHIYETHLNSDFLAKKKDNLYVYKGIEKSLKHYVYSNNKIDIREDEIVVKSIMTTQEPDKYTKTTLFGRSYLVEGSDIKIVEILSTKNSNVKEEKDYLLINNKDKLYLNLDNSDAIGMLKTDNKIILFSASYYKDYKFNNKANWIIEVKDEIFK